MRDKYKLMRQRRHAEVARKRQSNGLAHLPANVVIAIESQTPVPEKTKPTDPPAANSVDDLINRLTAIRERLFWLHAVWSTTLSRDIALEMDRYRRVFQELGEQLKAKDPEAFSRLVAGHEALLLAKAAESKGTIPIEVQRRFELFSELQSAPSPKPTPAPSGYVPDGLQGFL